MPIIHISRAVVDMSDNGLLYLQVNFLIIIIIILQRFYTRRRRRRRKVTVETRGTTAPPEDDSSVDIQSSDLMETESERSEAVQTSPVSKVTTTACCLCVDLLLHIIFCHLMR